jgi:hypothetical protein
MLPFVHQFLLRPRWLAGFIGDGGLMNFPNVVLEDGPMSYADVGAALEQSTVCWADLRWIREVWKGPIVIKGLMIGDDARRAVDEGSGVVVSNHGGRQLTACIRRCARAAGSRGRERSVQCSTAASAAALTSRRHCAGRAGGAHQPRVCLQT